MGEQNNILDFSHMTQDQFKQLVNNDNVVKTLNDNSKSLEKQLSDRFKENDTNFNKFSDALLKEIQKQKTVDIGKSVNVNIGDKFYNSINSIEQQNNDILTELQLSNQHTQYLANQIYFATVVFILIFVSLILYKAIKKFI